jgi:ankyrin repeat protein
VNTVQTLFRKQDRVFNSTFDSLKNKLWNAIQTTTLERSIKEISETEHVRTIRDHLGRSLLHMAVEQQNVNLVHCLLHAGVNPNLKEMCGVTPLIIAVITNNKEICKMLVNSQASVRGPLFTNIPSPLAVAMKMELEEIYELLDPSLSDQEDDDITSYDPGFK